MMIQTAKIQSRSITCRKGYQR